jgi:flavin-dependent dehydrogenase
VESERQIPVVCEADIVVVGGSTGAVSAAIAAKEAGAKVFLLAPRPYLGEDMCESRRLWLEEGEEPASPLARKLFAPDPPKAEKPSKQRQTAVKSAEKPTTVPAGFVRLVRPMHVKRTLDEALLAAKVEFLFRCFASDALRDKEGKLCGIVMANRSGRQAILAKVIIDATPRAVVARMAGAEFSPYTSGEQTFQRVVIGGQVKEGDKLSGRKVGLQFPVTGQGGPLAYKERTPKQAEVIEYTLKLPMPDAGFASFAAADQLSRDLLWDPGILDIAESLFQVPPDQLRSVKPGASAAPASLELDSLRPVGVERLYVLGGCADVDRPCAARLLRPLALIDLGTRVGQAAAADAKSLPTAKSAQVADVAAKPAGERPKAETVAGDVRETLVGVRPTQRGLPTVASPSRSLPVLGHYDAIVIGGGTGGAPAGIGASRGGAKTLLVEYLCGLGGVGTQGRIINYYFGYRGGFTKEVDVGLEKLRASNYVMAKSEWWRQANRRAGTDLWMGAMGCGAFVENGLVKGVVVATPLGRGVVLAKTVIDSTGNADVAAAAGAECDYTAGDDVAVQGAGLPPLDLGDGYTNTDWTFADDTDVVDASYHFLAARAKFREAYDLGQLVDTRERRRIVGDVVVSPMDIVLGRFWPDTINRAQSNFDTHGFTVHPMFYAMPPGHEQIAAWVPFRALTPRGMDGILVTGLGASAHRDAMPVIRMQADVQNQGYACGRAAALAAKSKTTVRNVDVKALQKHLAEAGVLPTGVPPQKDSFPLPKEKVAAAVAGLLKPGNESDLEPTGPVRNRQALSIIFAHSAEAQPLLVKAHAQASGTDRLAYALVLGLMGRPEAADTLVEHVRSAPVFDKGWIYTGMGQFGRSVSELDACIIALGRTRDRRTVDVVAEKVKLLDAKAEFSHHRACAMALESLDDPKAAAPLAELLKKPSMTGHAWTQIDSAMQVARASGRTGTKDRNDSLRELIVARALYRCGDQDGLGKKVLEQYSQDLRGHYARHARAVLDEKGPGAGKPSH